MGTSTPPPSVTTGQAAASYTPSTLAAGTTYYWQIVAHSSGGVTSGPIWSFTTAPKITPTITWATPANIVYGTPLGATQLNATANVPGTFVYTPASGTVLNAGIAQTLSTTFTPTDTNTYATTTASVLIRRPIIRRPTAAVERAPGASWVRLGSSPIMSFLAHVR